jgi:hypothetical protein
MDSNIWRSIMLFIVLISSIGLVSIIFFPGH